MEIDTENRARHLQAFRPMQAYVRWLVQDCAHGAHGAHGMLMLAMLRLLALFERSASKEQIEALWYDAAIPGLNDHLRHANPDALAASVKRLQQSCLVNVRLAADGAWTRMSLQPMVRAYFVQELRCQSTSTSASAWQQGNLYLSTMLCASARLPETSRADDLQPLYQALAQHCQAGLYTDALSKVFHERIARGDPKYTLQASARFNTNLCALSHFFDPDTGQPMAELPAGAQTWLLQQVFFLARFELRLHDALRACQILLKNALQEQDWHNAAVNASSASDCHLLLGQIDAACAAGAQALSYAGRCEHSQAQVDAHVQYAHALHQAGQFEQALALMRQAELRQARLSPKRPLLDDLNAFFCCDLLLSHAERQQDHATARQVLGRAQRALKLAEQESAICAASLAALTLARATLLEAKAGRARVDDAGTALQQAMDWGLRNVMTFERVHIWISRATFYHASGQADAAVSDLNLAWNMATCGPLPLIQADILLLRLRLFGQSKAYPWNSVTGDLQAVRRLIATHGYERRKSDLAAIEGMLMAQ